MHWLIVVTMDGSCGEWFVRVRLILIGQLYTGAKTRHKIQETNDAQCKQPKVGFRQSLRNLGFFEAIKSEFDRQLSQTILTQETMFLGSARPTAVTRQGISTTAIPVWWIQGSSQLAVCGMHHPPLKCCVVSWFSKATELGLLSDVCR